MLAAIRRMRPPALAWLAAGAFALAAQFVLSALLTHVLLRRTSRAYDNGCASMGVEVPFGPLAPEPTAGFLGHRLEFAWWPLGYRCVLDYETHRVVHERWTITVAVLLALALMVAGLLLVAAARRRAVGIGAVVPMPRDALVLRTVGAFAIVGGALGLLALFWGFERVVLEHGLGHAAAYVAWRAPLPVLGILAGAWMHVAAGVRHDRLREPQNSRSSPDSSPFISS